MILLIHICKNKLFYRMLILNNKSKKLNLKRYINY